jgi:hypothetical protein
MADIIENHTHAHNTIKQYGREGTILEVYYVKELDLINGFINHFKFSTYSLHHCDVMSINTFPRFDLTTNNHNHILNLSPPYHMHNTFMIVYPQGWYPATGDYMDLPAVAAAWHGIIVLQRAVELSLVPRPELCFILEHKPGQ